MYIYLYKLLFNNNNWHQIQIYIHDIYNVCLSVCIAYTTQTQLKTIQRNLVVTIIIQKKDKLIGIYI